jgi:hypothetical protein
MMTITDEIIVENGRDGKWAAYAMGAMGRPIVASAENGDRALQWAKIMLAEQESECYAHEQQMTHLSLIRDGEYEN